MVAKVTTEMLAAVGAKSADEFTAKFSAFIADAKLMAEKSVTLESLQASITALEGKLISEARVKELVAEGSGAAATSAISAWSASAEGKKIIGAESSRICMESLAAVGTQPAKPAPVGNAGVDNSKGLIAQGKFKEVYAATPALQKDFSSAETYEAYMKAVAAGHVQPEN